MYTLREVQYESKTQMVSEWVKGGAIVCFVLLVRLKGQNFDTHRFVVVELTKVNLIQSRQYANLAGKPSLYIGALQVDLRDVSLCASYGWPRTLAFFRNVLIRFFC